MAHAPTSLQQSSASPPARVGWPGLLYFLTRQSIRGLTPEERQLAKHQPGNTGNEARHRGKQQAGTHLPLAQQRECQGDTTKPRAAGLIGWLSAMVGSGTGIRTPVPWLRTTCPNP